MSAHADAIADWIVYMDDRAYSEGCWYWLGFALHWDRVGHSLDPVTS